LFFHHKSDVLLTVKEIPQSRLCILLQLQYIKINHDIQKVNRSIRNVNRGI